MLRHHGEQNHQHHAQRRWRRKAGKRPLPPNPCQQDRNPENHTDNMHPQKPEPNPRPRLVPARQYPESPWRYHKAQKHVAPQPQAQSKKFECAEQAEHESTIQDRSYSGHRTAFFSGSKHGLWLIGDYMLHISSSAQKSHDGCTSLNRWWENGKEWWATKDLNL